MSEALFSYDPGNGEKKFADPFEIEHRLVKAFMALGTTEQDAYKLSQLDHPVQKAEGIAVIVKATREAFECVPFNGMTGEGCSYSHAVEIYRSFWDWSDQKKMSGGEIPPLPPSTESAYSISLPT